MNNMNSLKLKDTPSIKEQREILLQNYDKVFGVYELLEQKDDFIEFDMLENCLVTFENQISSLKGLDETPDITIFDLNKLGRGEFKVLHGPSPNYSNKNISMISGGMIDFFVTKRGNTHALTSMRDAGGTSQNTRTNVAGRVIGTNIRENIEYETREEAPFLGIYNSEFYLAVQNEHYDYLSGSIENFLENKYNPDDQEKKDLFERGFRGLKYEELGDVLRDILTHKRFLTYESEDVDDMPGLEDIKKTIKIGDKIQDYYVVYNKDQNTYECKIFKIFKKFPDGFKLPGNRPNRLYLESSNQHARFTRIENYSKLNPAGNIKPFVGLISKNYKEIDEILNMSKS